MKRFILSVAAVAMSLALVGAAEAAPRGDRYGNSGHHDSRSYHERYGTKFKYGYYYKGHDHHHWTYRYWYGRYGCYCYYCPSTYCWYYWYPTDNCYYPVSYIKTATPVFETAPRDVVTDVQQIVNVTNNSPGSVTAGKGGPGGVPVGGAPGAPAPMPPAPPGQ